MIPRGAPIAIIAPSHAYDPARLAQGLVVLREHGHRPVLFEDMLRPERTFAAPRAQRLDHLVQALTDPRFAAVWMVRGGSGLTQLLRDLPWEDLPQRPVIGFSDVTALLVALSQRVGSPVVHGPMPHSLPMTDEASTEHLFSLLAGEEVAPLSGETWVEGEATGRLTGGNLALLAALCGTPWQLDSRDRIVVIEEVGEHPYRIERMLQQLVDSGSLDGVAGVALGELRGCEAPKSADWTLRDAVMAHLEPLGVPVVAGLPIGHGARNMAWPYGVEARIGEGELAW